MVKAGLKLIGDNHHLVIIAIKGFAHIAAFEPRVHIGFGKLFTNQCHRIWIFFGELHFAGEGHHRRNVLIAFLGLLGHQVLIQRQLIAHRFFTGTGDDHGLGLAAQQTHNVIFKVLDDDLYFLADVVVVQAHPLIEFNFGLFAFDFFVFIRNFHCQVIGHFIVGVVFQHIQNKAFFNGLTHAVDMIGLRLIGF